MGTWGPSPWDSDDALDLSDVIVSKLTAVVNKALRDRTGNLYQKGRAAVEMMVRLHDGYGVPPGEMVHARDLLAKIAADKRWVSEWKEPTRVARRLKKDIADLDVIIALDKRRMTALLKAVVGPKHERAHSSAKAKLSKKSKKAAK